MYKQLVLILIITASFSGANVVVADAGQFKLDSIMANRGDAGAQFSVAIAYEDGVGTSKDIKQAFDWYSKAAKQGHAGAQYKMGTFYEQGRVVKKDTKAAMEWYKQAADNGSRQAKQRMSAMSASGQKQEQAAAASAEQERAKQQAAAAKAEQQRQAAAASEKAKKEAATAKKPPTKVAVAAPPPPKSKPKSKPKAAPKQADIPDIMDVVANNNWKTGSMAADYLPSSATRCAQTGTEVICFSDERARIVSGQKVTYTTKATLNNFKRDGTFRVSYVYNAVKLDPTNVRGTDKDAYGLRAQEGWQEPEIVVNCQTTDRKNLYCGSGKSRFHYER